MSGNFPPDFFAPDYFTPEYFGGETDSNALLASISGSATVTATLTAAGDDIAASITAAATVTADLTVATAQEEDVESFLQEYKKKRRKKAAKPVVIGEMAALIVGRASLFALGEAPRVAWTKDIEARIGAVSTVHASIEGPDRIAEQDELDMEELEAILVLLAA